MRRWGIPSIHAPVRSSPRYDINLSGIGDVVMTGVRQTSSILIIPESVVIYGAPDAPFCTKAYSPFQRSGTLVLLSRSS